MTSSSDLLVEVDSRGHEPMLHRLLEPLVLEKFPKAKVECCQIKTGDVHWEGLAGEDYYVERKAFCAERPDLTHSFNWAKGRLRYQLKRLSYGMRAALVVEGPAWTDGPGGYVYEQDSGLLIGYPCRYETIYGLLCRIQLEGIIVKETRSMEETAKYIARLIWLTRHPTKWLK